MAFLRGKLRTYKSSLAGISLQYCHVMANNDPIDYAANDHPVSPDKSVRADNTDKKDQGFVMRSAQQERLPFMSRVAATEMRTLFD